MKTMLSFSWEDLADLLQDRAPSLAQGKMAARGVNAIRRRSDLGELNSRALLEQILALVWLMQATPANGPTDPVSLLVEIRKALIEHETSSPDLVRRIRDRTKGETTTLGPWPTA
jgi:hypothetical protein